MAYPSGGEAPCDQAQPPDADHAAYTGLLRSIRAVDAQTVEFRLCAGDVAFPVRLASAAGAINDTAWLESHVDGDVRGEQAIVRDVNGTGPYRLEAWNRGSDIDLVRNDAYWGDPARTQQLIVRWRDDAGARFAELQAGTVDGIDDVDPADVQAVRDDVDLTALARPGLNVFYVGFNDTYAPFDGAKVRQAIAMGIDRDRIVQALYPPGSEVASHVSPCAIPYGCGSDGWYAFNPFAARQLLEDAGFRDGFDTTIQYREASRPYLPDPTAAALELQAQLKSNLNIRATLEVLPDDAYLTTVDTGHADGIHLLGRIASVPDASTFLDPLFGAGASSEFGKPNDALVSALITGSAATDEAARTDAYRGANSAIRSDVPMIPIAHAGSMIAFRADVEGAQASPLRVERFAAMTPGDRNQFVWLTSAEPAGLYCADETSASAQLVCAQVSEGLYAYVPGRASVAPALATACRANPELTTWTCTLRPDVTFHDGSSLDANDVVLSFAVQWDAEHPLHRGREGQFQPFIDAFGGFLNPPAPR
jgi:ABC-type transport system substrate-binding protein